ncbi:SGNH hydrolase, partial [Exidia glandulosa HHB12029]
ATTGSTIASGQFDAALAIVRSLVAEGRRTLVTVQFGHNDQKIAPPESMGANLTIMVDAIRAAKGEPVLVTSLTRRNFLSNGTVDDALEPWAEETLLIAQQEGTHSLDLHKTSIDYITAIGPDAAHRLNRLPDDNTHLNTNGTIVFGRCALYIGFLRVVSKPAIRQNGGRAHERQLSWYLAACVEPST